ncbi:uncharacterized protein DUF2624 [Melghiribacillus thermohalophilus]|uniref:Uncharacterized protein DUF2624 n=1 Tax=Melghiribacillus thermohalophilus TaxID=1324956 RepID=A0A4R3NI73_9BACI|nr:DUF2624 family protein [Melghiribacillus thermohalophilus]TCT26992.1 uncharacterized protein DUF2624 [Melghiribacillus thermohalophilus]
MKKSIIKQMVQQKLQNLSVRELLYYAEAYDFHITKKQAEDIISFLKSTRLDPFNERDRLKMLRKIASVTDKKTAQKVYRLFKSLAKQYGVEYLL